MCCTEIAPTLLKVKSRLAIVAAFQVVINPAIKPALTLSVVQRTVAELVCLRMREQLLAQPILV